MHAVTGKQFKNLVRGTGLTMQQVQKEAGLSSGSVSLWVNGKNDILLEGTYNKLVAAFEKLKAQEEKK